LILVVAGCCGCFCSLLLPWGGDVVAAKKLRVFDGGLAFGL